jgi:hypothetical protein
VDAFVDTADNVRHQSTVLGRLLRAATQEFLAVSHLSEPLAGAVRRLVSGYVQSVSFASLAFLSSPEASAGRNLAPKVLRHFRHLQLRFEDLAAGCEVERMLEMSVDADLRRTLKAIEFRSIGHLLEVCHGYRAELSRIALAPDVRAPGFDGAGSFGTHSGNEGSSGRSGAGGGGGRGAVRQALRDLQREVITVNGRALPPAASRRELVSLLRRTLSSRALAGPSPGAAGGPARSASPPRPRKGAGRRPGRGGGTPDPAAGPAAPGIPPIVPSGSAAGDEPSTSEYDTDPSAAGLRPLLRGEGTGGGGSSPAPPPRRRGPRVFPVDFLTRRLLLAASRTGTFGDAYFVVRDLFGGDGVEVVPSRGGGASSRRGRGGAPHPASIEISVRLASLTIRCHGSFDVYPKGTEGDCEPLIQLHTTTTETIGLQEVRAADCEGSGGSSAPASSVRDEDLYDSGGGYGDEDGGGDDDEEEEDGEPGAEGRTRRGRRRAALVVQERPTERTGWRYLSIRPAPYEKHEDFSTPS